MGYLKGLGANPSIRNRSAAILKLTEYSSIKDPKELLIKLYDWEV